MSAAQFPLENARLHAESLCLENSCTASQPQCDPSRTILAAIREEATRRHKDVNELAGELIMESLYREKNRNILEKLQKYGEEQAISKFGRVPNEEGFSISSTRVVADRCSERKFLLMQAQAFMHFSVSKSLSLVTM